MEKYLFRAFENGTMYYQVRVGGMFDDMATAPTVFIKGQGWVNLTGEEYTKVMQYTNYDSSENNPIYDKDVVLLGCYSEDSILAYVTKQDGIWVTIDREGNLELLHDVIKELAIIGNVYENENLLNDLDII